jgi:hypothetical protein
LVRTFNPKYPSFVRALVVRQNRASSAHRKAVSFASSSRSAVSSVPELGTNGRDCSRPTRTLDWHMIGTRGSTPLELKTSITAYITKRQDSRPHLDLTMKFSSCRKAPIAIMTPSPLAVRYGVIRPSGAMSACNRYDKNEIYSQSSCGWSDVLETREAAASRMGLQT